MRTHSSWGKVTGVCPSSAGNGHRNWRCPMRIGFIGLGNMGGPMALNVMKAGHTMVINDIRRDMAAPHLRQGATWADTPKAVAEQSELIFTSLPGPREVEAVALGENGILTGAAPGSIYADLS